jgi:hypothetical protein
VWHSNGFPLNICLPAFHVLALIYSSHSILVSNRPSLLQGNHIACVQPDLFSKFTHKRAVTVSCQTNLTHAS